MHSSMAAGFWCVDVDLNGQGAQFESTEDTLNALLDWQYGREILGGRRLPRSPLVFRHARKSRWYDLLWCGQEQILVVSTRLVDVLRAEGATGWRSYPLTLLDRKGNEIAGYQGLAVTGRVESIRWKRAERFWHPPAVPTGEGCWRLRGLWFDEKDWDGSDIFFPEPTMYLMATARIVRAMKRAKMKGIEFVHQSRFEIDEDTVEYILRRQREQKRSQGRD